MMRLPASDIVRQLILRAYDADSTVEEQGNAMTISDALWLFKALLSAEHGDTKMLSDNFTYWRGVFDEQDRV